MFCVDGFLGTTQSTAKLTGCVGLSKLARARRTDEGRAEQEARPEEIVCSVEWILTKSRERKGAKGQPTGASVSEILLKLMQTSGKKLILNKKPFLIIVPRWTCAAVGRKSKCGKTKRNKRKKQRALMEVGRC